MPVPMAEREPMRGPTPVWKVVLVFLVCALAVELLVAGLDAGLGFAVGSSGLGIGAGVLGVLIVSAASRESPDRRVAAERLGAAEG